MMRMLAADRGETQPVILYPVIILGIGLAMWLGRCTLPDPLPIQGWSAGLVWLGNGTLEIPAGTTIALVRNHRAEVPQ